MATGGFFRFKHSRKAERRVNGDPKYKELEQKVPQLQKEEEVAAAAATAAYDACQEANKFYHRAKQNYDSVMRRQKDTAAEMKKLAEQHERDEKIILMAAEQFEHDVTTALLQSANASAFDAKAPKEPSISKAKEVLELAEAGAAWQERENNPIQSQFSPSKPNRPPVQTQSASSAKKLAL